MTQTDAILQQWLTRAVSAGGPYDPVACFLGLATAIANKGALTTMADVTKPTGALGTADAVTAWSTPYKLPDGRWCVDGPAQAFRPADATEGATISHWYIAAEAGATTLKSFGALSPPVGLLDQTSQLTIVVRITIDPAGRFDVTESF